MERVSVQLGWLKRPEAATSASHWGKRDVDEGVGGGVGEGVGAGAGEEEGVGGEGKGVGAGVTIATVGVVAVMLPVTGTPAVCIAWARASSVALLTTPSAVALPCPAGTSIVNPTTMLPCLRPPGTSSVIALTGTSRESAIEAMMALRTVGDAKS
jgi:hypothetical protein